METSAAAVADASAADPYINNNQIKLGIAIPEILKDFPGIRKIDILPLSCGKRKTKRTKDCGCNSACEFNAVKQIRTDYLANLESDVKSGHFDSNYCPKSNPAGASHIQKFVKPVATANPKTTTTTTTTNSNEGATEGRRQQYVYDITIATPQSTTTFTNICTNTFQQIFCLRKEYFQKIKNDMMNKPTPARRAKKNGLTPDVEVVLLNQIVPEQTKSVYRICNGDTVKRISFVKNDFDGWIQLLTILGNDNKFLEQAKASKFYPTYHGSVDSTSNTNNNAKPAPVATTQQQQQQQPSIPYQAVRHYLENKIEKTEEIGKLNSKPPQQQRKTRSSSRKRKASSSDSDDDDDGGVVLLITGNGIYMEDLCFQSDEQIQKAYGRCQQCKILRTLDENVIEVSVNILTLISYFNDPHHNYHNLYGTVFDGDNDPVPSPSDDLRKWGTAGFEWLRDGKLNGRRIKDIHFVGIGFKVNGGGLSQFMEEVIDHQFNTLLNKPNITVVDINPKANRQNSKIEKMFKAQELGINFVTDTADSYLQKLIMERTQCNPQQYDDMMKNATYPTTHELNTAYATPHPTLPGRHIQKELPPVNDKFVELLWPIICEKNNYIDPKSSRTLRNGSSINSRQSTKIKTKQQQQQQRQQQQNSSRSSGTGGGGGGGGGAHAAAKQRGHKKESNNKENSDGVANANNKKVFTSSSRKRRKGAVVAAAANTPAANNTRAAAKKSKK